MAVRTSAPVGQTPTLRVKLTHDHLCGIGGSIPEGRICMQTQDHSYKSLEVVRFVQILWREIPGKVLVIWDGAPIHRSEVLKDCLAQGGTKRLHLERLPASAPALNPPEGVWNVRQQRRTEERLWS